MNGLYIGSFDMFTNGHLDILEQAICLFDKVYVVIGRNPIKKRRYSPESSMEFMHSALSSKPYFDKLELDITLRPATEYAILHRCQYLIRGIRNTTDYAYEENLANVYKEMLPEIKIIYFRSNLPHVSSTMIDELIHNDFCVNEYLPADRIILERYER